MYGRLWHFYTCIQESVFDLLGRCQRGFLHHRVFFGHPLQWSSLVDRVFWHIWVHQLFFFLLIMNRCVELGMPSVFEMFLIDWFSFLTANVICRHCRVPHVVTHQQISPKAIAKSRMKTRHQQLSSAITNDTNECTCLTKLWRHSNNYL